MTESARLPSLKAMLKAEVACFRTKGAENRSAFGPCLSVEMDLRWIQLAELVGATLLPVRRHAVPQLVGQGQRSPQNFHPMRFHW